MNAYTHADISDFIANVKPGAFLALGQPTDYCWVVI